MWYVFVILLSNIMSFWNNFSNDSMSGGRSTSPPFNSLSRSPSSPFCTSPSQLQEITLDQDGLFARAIGFEGAEQTGTVKEFTELVSKLKKENFKLKLRIFFLEEKMGTNFTLDEDNVIRKNIELQAEIGNLQQEVKEKHELLCQAVRAMELEEEEQKKYAKQKESELEICRQEIDELKKQLQMASLSRNSSSNGGSFLFDQSDTTLRFKFEHLQKEIQLKDNTINSLTKDLTSTNCRLIDFTNQIKEYEEKLTNVHLDNENLNVQLKHEQKANEQLFQQLTSVNKEYSRTKQELEQELRYKEHQQVAFDNFKKMSKQRMATLEDENLKQIGMIKDLQCQLNVAVDEAIKNQTIAVSKLGNDKQCNSNIDVDFISAATATTSDGTKKNISSDTPLSNNNTFFNNLLSSSKLGNHLSSISASQDFKVLKKLEELLNENLPIGQHRSDIFTEFNLIKNEFDVQQKKILKLNSEQSKACQLIKNLIAFRNKTIVELKELQDGKKQLEKEMENMVSKPQKDNLESESAAAALREPNKLDSIDLVMREKPPISTLSSSHDAEIAEQYQQLSSELETKNEVLLEILQVKESQLQQIKLQYDELEKLLVEKENRIVDLEFDLLNLEDSNIKTNKSISDCGDFLPHINSMDSDGSLIGKQQEEIKQLKHKLTKSNSYLQEIVNKELWERNREIEKLHKKNESIVEIEKLKKELIDKDQQLKMLKERISVSGLDIKLPSMETSNKDEISESRLIEILKYQNEQTKSELDECEKIKNKSNEICIILSKRLHELAIFLDDLLKQNLVLGLLGTDKKLRQIVDSSLQMSQSFNDSFVVNPEHSLAELTNITDILNGSIYQDLKQEDQVNATECRYSTHLSIIPDNISLTYESHLYRKDDNCPADKDEIIQVLRKQIFHLENELKLRDNEINKMNACQQVSEADEETTTVSALHDSRNTSSTLKFQNDQIQSESEAWSEPDRSVSRARMGLALPVETIKRSSITIRHNESTDDSSSIKRHSGSSGSVSKKRSNELLNQEIRRLENEIEIKSKEFSECEIAMKDKLKQFEIELNENRKKLEEMRNDRGNIEMNLIKLETIIDDFSTVYGIDNDKNVIDRESFNFDNVFISMESKLKMMKVKFLAYKEMLNKEHEKRLNEQLSNAEKSMKIMEEKHNVELKFLEENIEKLKEQNTIEINRKNDDEKKLKILTDDLMTLKMQIESNETTIKLYKDKEFELKQIIEEYRDQINCLKQKFDQAEQHCSNLVMEKAKLMEEKVNIHEQMMKLNEKIDQNEKLHEEIKSKYTEASHEITTLKMEKSALELKLSEVEIANAELHNRLIKLQMTKFNLSAATGEGLSPIVAMGNNGQQLEQERTRPTAESAADNERAAASSSPDLGIDSDHGRFSSLENNNVFKVPGPLVQNIQLTQSMNNLFDAQNVVDVDTNDNAVHNHCCQKSIDMSRENNELRRKIIRMKRALEETTTQLNLANQRKKQVEKTICKQIHKTSQVLRKVKANLDSGSDTEALRM